MRKFLLAILAILASLTLTWTWGGGDSVKHTAPTMAAVAYTTPTAIPISANALEQAHAIAHPDAFVVPNMATATDFLFCGQFGGKIYNTSDSSFTIAVYTGCANNGVPRGHWSNEWFAMRDVDFFYVGGGHNCKNIDTGYIYQGTASIGSLTRFTMASDTVSLRLRCYTAGL